MAIGSAQWMYASGGDFTIPYSCRFDSTRSTHMERTMGTPTNAKKWVYSGWCKLGKANYQEMSIFNGGLDGSGSGEGDIQWNANEELYVYQYSGGYQYRLYSTAKFRDTTAWYHIVVAVDTTQATASNRVLVYVNGERITDWVVETYPSQNLDSTAINTACEHRIGNERSDSREFDGYLAEVHFIDGMSFFSNTSGAANSSFNINTFGETGDYGEWKPIEVSGVTYGNNGIYHDFADAADLGDDESGEGNDFSETNLVATDQMLDSPTNNFCTWNPLAENHRMTMTEGNLKCFNNLPPNTALTLFGTHIITSGKWYFEARGSGNPDGDNFGFCTTENGSGGEGTGEMSFYIRNNSNIEGVGVELVYGSGGTVEACAIDMDAGKFWWAKENVWHGSGNPAAGTNAYDTFTATEMIPAMNIARNNHYLWVNFGADSSFAGEETAQGNQDSNGRGDFYYTPPSGFLALCSANLPAPAVIPSEHFDTAIYSGSSSTVTINDVGFQPDMLWAKKRSATESHAIVDVLRGVSPRLEPNNSNAEEAGGITSFDSDGFTVGGGSGRFSENGHTYVGWMWKGGGSGSANTSGDINSTVSANVDAGFSIVTWSGTNSSSSTVGHGLSKAPELVIGKVRTNTYNWIVGSDVVGWDKTLKLNLTSAETTHNPFANTAPNSTGFYVGGPDAHLDGSGETYVAYCFHSVAGYSKIGSYHGNNDADGTFVSTGFTPAYVMVKRLPATDSWLIQDNKRETYNEMDDTLAANSSGAEDADTGGMPIDFVSNGFKMRGTGGDFNGADNGIYLYIAFAEIPFKYATAR